MIELLKQLVNNLGYIIVIVFFISRFKTLKQIVLREKLGRLEIIVFSLIFGVFGILGTYIGIDVRGAIANTRNIGVMVGGILCGPFVGVVAGGIAIVILITENIFEAKEEIAAKQARVVLQIANKTLPHFREVTRESLKKVCEIIRNSVEADAVAITDREYILAHVGIGEDNTYNVKLRGVDVQIPVSRSKVKAFRRIMRI